MKDRRRNVNGIYQVVLVEDRGPVGVPQPAQSSEAFFCRLLLNQTNNGHWTQQQAAQWKKPLKEVMAAGVEPREIVFETAYTRRWELTCSNVTTSEAGGIGTAIRSIHHIEPLDEPDRLG